MPTIKFSDFNNIAVPINGQTWVAGYDTISGTPQNCQIGISELNSVMSLSLLVGSLNVNKLVAGTDGYILNTTSGVPTWFNLFGTANTFTAMQTIQSNTTRVLRLNGVNSGGYASGTTISASAANQPVTVTNAQGIIFTLNESVNTNSYFPLFTFANRSLGGYVATVPEWQLRCLSVGTGSTACRVMEITIPSSTAFTASQIAERWDIFNLSSSYAFKQHYLRTSIDTAGALNPASALLHIGAAATGYAQINLKTSAGTAPSAPADGDIWYDGTNLKMRVGAVTKTFTLV